MLSVVIMNTQDSLYKRTQERLGEAQLDLRNRDVFSKELITIFQFKRLTEERRER